MQRATSQAQAEASSPEAGAPIAAGIYWTMRLPRHWVVEVEGRLWTVPAVFDGWQARQAFDGERAGLRPYTPRTAKIIRRLLARQI